MSRSTRFLIPLWCSALLTSCDANVLAPNRDLGPQAAAARAVGSSFGAWPVSASQISMSWTDNSRNETGWEVHRSTTGATGTFTVLASLAANVTDYSNTGLEPFTEYCYKVRSFKKSGPNTSFATFTIVSCSRTFGPPPAPSALSAVPQGANTIILSWTDNATNETAMRVERAPDPSGPWQVAVTAGPNATSFTDYGRTVEVQVCYRVIAVNQYGESASTTDCTAPPEWPRNVSATSSDASSIDVTWTDNSNVEDGYEVKRSLDGSTWSVIANLPANSTSFHDGTVTPDVRYWYVLRAMKDGGFSYSSGTAYAAAASSAPSSPTGSYASPSGSTWAVVAWTNSSVTTAGFRIERSINGQASWVTAGTAQATDWTFYDADRIPEAQVCYRVFAFNAIGESAPSNVDCTIPPAGPTNLVLAAQEDGSNLLTWTDNSNVEEQFEIWYSWCYWWDEWYYECYWDVRYAEANSTSATFWPGETVEVMYALFDGGYSDPGTWAGAGSLSRVTNGPVVRPIRGAQAPRPTVVRRPAQQRSRLTPLKSP